jgi:GNAT superfamily N-acetyltransferase
VAPIIRDLEFSDLAGLLALYEDLHAQDDVLPARSMVEETWRAILDDPTQIYLGGFVDGALVSACNAAVIRNLTRGARPYAVIENVVTARHHRRCGFGSAVLQELLTRCWARQCYKVMLLSGMNRTDVHAFYDSNGFDRTAKQAFIITAR